MRGAAVTTWEPAALGMTALVRERLAAQPGTDLDALLWAACHGGHLDTATHLVDGGAVDVVGWLQARGARRGRGL